MSTFACGALNRALPVFAYLTGGSMSNRFGRDYTFSKFQNYLAERFWNLSLEGGADHEVSFDDGSWYGLFKMRRGGGILSTGSQGVVFASPHPPAQTRPVL